MTVPQDDYLRSLYQIRADRTYAFPWRWIGAESVEVYELLEDDTRIRVRAQDFTLTTDTPFRNPTKAGGTIRFNRRHQDGVDRVIIERNTLIVNNADMPVVDPFNTRMIEAQLDKLTLIFQEIDNRKCESNTTTPITQLLVFGSYFKVKASQIDSALDKLTQIALEIDQTADNCRGRPDEV